MSFNGEENRFLFLSLSLSLFCVSSSYLDFPTFLLTPFLKKKVTSDEKTPKDVRDAEEEEKEREREGRERKRERERKGKREAKDE